MVSIGGDRATKADYDQANKQARLRSQKTLKPKPAKSSSPPSWRPDPAPQRKSQYQVPAGLRDRPAARGYQAPAKPREAPQQVAIPAPREDVKRFLNDSNSDPRMGVTSSYGLSPQGTRGPGNAPAAGTYGGPPADDQLMLPTAGAAISADEAQAQAAKQIPSKQTADKAAVARGRKPPPLSDSARAFLTSMKWKVPKGANQVEMSKDNFEKGGKSDLVDYKYQISDDEFARIMATYNTPAARAAGYVPPASGVVTKASETPLIDLQDEDESQALSWEAYQKQSEQQRAAIDLNSLLVETRESDLREKPTLVGPALNDYNESVLKMFGKGHGSDTVAPATVGLLSRLEVDLQGQDLDEWLSLERAQNTKEIGKFKFSKDDVRTLNGLMTQPEAPYAPQPLTGAEAYADVRSPENLAAVDTATIKGAHQLAQDALKAGAMPISFETLVNGLPEGTLPPTGFGTSETKWATDDDAKRDEWYRNAFTALSQKDPATFLGQPKGTDVFGFMLNELNAVTGNDKAAEQKFLDYLGNMSDLLIEYGTPEDADVAEIIRKNAQLGG